MTAESLEVEVKFLVDDLPAVRKRLLTNGAKQVTARTYEYNVRYDNAWDGLSRQGKLLRLRQDQSARLTFKGPSAADAASEAKVREELEIAVGDFAVTAAILEKIGFQPRQIYEKYRETFQLGMVEVTLDEMPFGPFVELEGDEAGIQAAARELGLDWSRRVLDNYLVLLSRLKNRFNLLFDDLTFDNFSGLEVTIGDLFAAESS
jgi:adenylate cyclase class 2